MGLHWFDWRKRRRSTFCRRGAARTQIRLNEINDVYTQSSGWIRVFETAPPRLVSSKKGPIKKKSLKSFLMVKCATLTSAADEKSRRRRRRRRRRRQEVNGDDMAKGSGRARKNNYARKHTASHGTSERVREARGGTRGLPYI